MTGVRVHFINSGKYFLAMSVPFSLYYFISADAKKITNFYWYFYTILKFVETTYVICWDYYMDWGLLRSTSPGRYGLRPKT